uniref:Ig-like domain-containing protein n=1 Tax=Scleropages formosus TaxID=113540 RepID=A0A8C9RXI7_SCLFO
IVTTFGHLSVRSGGSLTIPCFYDQEYKQHVKYWCKGRLWTSCSTLVRSDSPQSKSDVSIADDPDQLVFTVTMTNLQEKDSDTYWCAVEIGGFGTMDDYVAVLLPITVLEGKLYIVNILMRYSDFIKTVYRIIRLYLYVRHNYCLEKLSKAAPFFF